MTEPRKKWVLVAEDNPHDAELTLRALAASHARPEVVVVRDGQEALDCLRRRNGFQARQDTNPAVMLLDLNMPKMGGLEVLRRVKGDVRLKAIPVVVLSSSREPSDLARCYQLGANAYVVKPAIFRQYVAALEEVRAFWVVINEPPPEDPSKPNVEPAQLAATA